MAVNTTPITEAELLKPLRLLSTDRLKVTLHGKKQDEFLLHTTNSLSSPERPLFPGDAARGDFPMRFPERKEVEGSFNTRWVVPTTDVSAHLIARLWPSAQVSMSDDAGIVYTYLLATLEQQKAAVKRTAEYHEHVRLRPLIQRHAVPTPQFVDDFPLKNGHKPMLHQRVGKANSEGSEGFGEFMEQGCGKTLTIIGEVDQLCQQPLENGRLFRVLIVAPKNVRANWAREFERFSAQPGRVTVLRGGAVERIKAILYSMVPQVPNQKYTVVVCSYEGLCRSWDTIGKLEWDLAVLDEAHFIKWPRTARAQHAFKLRDVSKRRRALTGTPVCNTPMDLFAQLEFLREGGSGFKTFEAFRKFYGVYVTTDAARGVKRLVDVQNLPFMRERLARMSFIVKKEEAMPDLPPKVYDVSEVEMTPEQEQLYETVANQLYLEIQDEMSGGDTRAMSINNILTKLLRLAQITSGFLTFDAIKDLDSGETLSPKIVQAITPNPKIEAVLKMLKEKEPNEKTIIWATWIHDIRTVSEALENAGIDHVTFWGGTSENDRKLAEERFNGDPSCRVLVANQACGGTGLNLVGYDWWEQEPKLKTNTTHEVFLSQNWSHPQRSQAEDRACRRGQRTSVRITDLCVPNTIDEEIRARVTNKRAMALEVQDLREVLRRVLGKEV